MNANHGPFFQTSGGSTAQDTIIDPNVYYYDEASTTFKPGNIFDGEFSDLAITSADYTVYYVHRQHLSRTSTNAFGGVLTTGDFSTTVVETSAVLDIVLHTIYGMSCPHNPSLNTIEAALDALVKYGVTPQFYATPSQQLYQLLLSHAPYRPIDAYATAGKWGFEDTAVAISAHLLAFELSNITDELSIKMGPVYLRRLVDLHLHRSNMLKGIALEPPSRHSPTAMCSEGSQARLSGGWALAATELAWGPLSGMSTNALQSMFEKAGNEISCADCHAALRARIEEVCGRWSEVKRTI